MRHLDREIRTIGDLVVALRETTTGGPLTWFRGQAQSQWGLVPGLARQGNPAAELTIIKRFKQIAAPYVLTRPLPGPEGEWEWVFLMQHHRAPTRLLDWTENPLVALYFAVQEQLHDAEEAALWCLDPIALNRSAGHNRVFDRDILAFGIDRALDDYLPERALGATYLLNPVAAIGPRNSPRMVAQAGTFTVIHKEATAIEAVADSGHIWRLIIPANAKAAMRTELKLVGISEHTLFPDLDRVAKLLGDLVQ